MAKAAVLVLVGLWACSSQGLRTSETDVDLGVAHVVHVRNGAMVPNDLDVRLGETVRFVFDDAGHNVTSVTSSGDMDPTWNPDGRYCSLTPARCYSDARAVASPQGSTWDFVAPSAGDWPLVCGLHLQGWTGSAEQIWLHVR